MKNCYSIKIKENTPHLFNANVTANIIYKISNQNGNAMSAADIATVNSLNPKSKKYIKRIEEIQNLGYSINFDSYQDNTFKLNLQLIDSDLPKILAHIVLDKYISQITKIPDIINKLNTSNPLNYDLSLGHNFYEYRLINFLVEAALGMTSKTVWTGKYAVIGGLIIVKSNADIVCYHLVDFNKFKEYLKNTCKLDNPSGSKMGYGEVYEENNETYIKLNFQFKT
ncbi:HpaII family restriction endonuclease [Carboxylicivirga marina]|uniref:HpaII family restriction endonuclease n=1 Tax=Carboxylicivirga marina TaxID=2800988 RepID=UPI0025991579|nr:HpaII family restriction endonuclease [uncultured Carboxylicivirga sp.]